MYLKTTLSFIFITVFISSCAFVPTVSDTQRYSDMSKMSTKQLTLSTIVLDKNVCQGMHDEGAVVCLMTYGVIVPAGSLVLASSIVLIGNTLHWLEYQGLFKNNIVLNDSNKTKEERIQ